MSFRNAALALVLAAGSLTAQGTAFAATVVGGTGLLTTSDANQIDTWLRSVPSFASGPLQFTNIFTKTVGSTSLEFHTAADLKGPTFVVFEATSNSGTQKVGGFNPASWNAAQNNWSFSPPNDYSAFIFNITDQLKYSQDGSGIARQYQTYNAANYGPTFGGGWDLSVRGDLMSGFAFDYSYGGTSYENSIINESVYISDYTIGRLEVYTVASVAAVPGPVAGAGLVPLLGFAGAWMVRRRKRAA